MALPFVSVVVVNYNGRWFIRACLTSLRRQSYPRHRFEVIVLDNGSSDGSCRFIRESFPEVRLIALRRNIGFAEGNNVGFRQARGDWLALLNSDAVAEPDWLAESVAATQAGVGGVASHIVFADDPGVVNSTGLELYRDGRGGDRDLRRAEPVGRPAGEVFGGCGAGLLLRRAMLDAVGGFDPGLFMYYEDLELCWRARRAGWRFVYAPAARVRHVGGGSAGVESPLQTRCVERNRALVNFLHGPVWLAAANVLGGAARCLRALARRRHVAAHATAAGSTLLRLPRYALRRWCCGGGNDAVYRRWSQPAPGR